MTYFTFWGALNLQKLVCILHLYNISVWTSYISSAHSHVWLVAMVVDNAGLQFPVGCCCYCEYTCLVSNFEINPSDICPLGRMYSVGFGRYLLGG